MYKAEGWSCVWCILDFGDEDHVWHCFVFSILHARIIWDIFNPTLLVPNLKRTCRKNKIVFMICSWLQCWFSVSPMDEVFAVMLQGGVRTVIQIANALKVLVASRAFIHSLFGLHIHYHSYQQRIRTWLIYAGAGLFLLPVQWVSWRMLKMICLRVEVLPLFGDGASIAAEKVPKGCPQQGFGQTSVSSIASICKDLAATSAGKSTAPMGENLGR